MEDIIEWEKLTREWSASLKKARAHQAIIDDKMSSCLKGTGRMPTLADLAKVEKYWELHLSARKATNKYIAKQINSNHMQVSYNAERRKSARKESSKIQEPDEKLDTKIQSKV